MNVEITLRRQDRLPEGFEEALLEEMTQRLNDHFDDDVHVRIKRGTAGISITGGQKDAKNTVSDIFQQVWQSSAEWFAPD